MAEPMPELTPAELDRLEDALEDLERPDVAQRWLDEEPSAYVRARMVEYRDLLVASREALPIEEVPSGTLDDVIAQAHRAAAVPAPAAPSGGSWWQRMRRGFLLPVVALAGTAVLVLWVGRPDQAGDVIDPPGSAPAPDAAAAAEAQASLERTDDDARDKDAIDEDEAEPAAEAAEEEISPEYDGAPPPQSIAPGRARAAGTELDAEASREQKQVVEGGYRADDQAKPDAKPIGGKLGNLGEAPEPVTKSGGGAAGPATGRWDIISRGDRARQAGDCVTARDEYAVALEDDLAAVRARAFAGIGLCDAVAGDSPSAESNYERARELDGSIDAFLDSQRQRRTPTKKRRSKSKKAKPINLDDAADPFG